ncbi:MAG: prolyl oligopeptidase family serine peptidase [Phycisphaerales bacterium]
MRIFSFALVASLACPSTLLAAELIPHQFSDALVIGGIGKSGRSPLRFDAVEHALVHGSFVAPHPGDTITAPDGTVRTWERAMAKDNATRIEHDALGAGYAFATFESDAPQVAVLEASGHSMVYVNGEPRVGDPYGYGFVRIPVALKQGKNEFLFACGRGGFSAQLTPLPSTQPWFLGADDTVPDLVVGSAEQVELGIVVVNPALDWARALTLELRSPDGTVTRTRVPDIMPTSVRKARASFAPGTIGAAGPVNVEVALVAGEGADRRTIATRSMQLNAVDGRSTRKITFVSEIDGSVQYYSVVPSTSTARPGLILSLHGASVEAAGQAACYSPKDFAVIACPTNRRPFGFDWEDWGRLDALEVLANAHQRFDTDPRRQWLTGHSMGGHGTWQLGALFPDRFAAIAPSAGWISFRTYGGGAEFGDSDIEAILRRAASPSETLALGRNYAQLGVYILHGDVDDNVPVGQARAMRRYLAAEDEGNHRDFVYYERRGANHWWGNECVDWPPLVRFFAERTLPDPKDVTHVEFVTPAPWVSATCHWITVDQQIEPLRTSAVDITRTEKGYEGSTRNVARLGITDLPPGDAPIELKLDGVTVQVSRSNAAAPTLWLARQGDAWKVDESRSGKTALRGGPFKDAFRNDMMFVYGTAGDDASDARLLAKTRFDAETWWYRGNGSVEIVADADFHAAETAGRNVVLYGSADTNAAWTALLGRCPVLVRNGSIKIGDRELAGDDLACVFAYPRSDDRDASVAVIAGTSATADRMTWRMPYFVSGVGYPDLTVLSSQALLKGAASVRIAGFFSNAWTVEDGTWAEATERAP